MNELLSIITINYNGFNDTCELIESLYKNVKYPFELIIVNNNPVSNDGELLKNKYSQVIVVNSNKNLGFAGGNNLGLAYAKGDYILFMNNDMIAKDNFVLPLIERLKSSDKIGIVSPKIKYTYAPDTIQYAGYTKMSAITLRNNLIGLNQKDDTTFDKPVATLSVHGACMMTSRDRIEIVGNMTDKYFLFYEEHDWSHQFQKAGYEIWYDPASTIYHKESMTIKRGTPLRLYYLSRARIIFCLRNRKGLIRILALIYQLLIAMPKNILQHLMKNNIHMANAVLTGAIDGLTNHNKYNE